MNAILLTPYDSAAYDHALETIYQARKAQKLTSIAENLAWISQQFLGKPYLVGALGEGPTGEFDQSPLYRTDFFDCVTFVNTVLAMVHSADLPTFRHQMLQMNYYGGLPQYEKRYHFMSVDWNPQQVKRGIVRDITQQIKDSEGQPIFSVAKAEIDRPSWFLHRTLSDIKLLTKISSSTAAQLLQSLHACAKKVSVANSELAYLPLDRLFMNEEPHHDLFAQIPAGAIVEIVRPAWDLRDKIGTYLQVSHLGFVFQRNGQLIFRHASSNHGVLDMPLITYLRDVCLPIKTIKGINVQAVL